MKKITTFDCMKTKSRSISKEDKVIFGDGKLRDDPMILINKRPL